MAHNNLAHALATKGLCDEAISEYREASRLAPTVAEPIASIGLLLKARGSLAEAVAALRKAHEIMQRKNHTGTALVAQELKMAERQISLVDRLPSILRGVDNAKDDDHLAIAELCGCPSRGLYAAAARFYAEAMRGSPALANDQQEQYRFDAARAAVLAGDGRGRDDPPLDSAARFRWRRQAIDWLRADMEERSKTLERTPPGDDRQSLVDTLLEWKVHTDLAGIRDEPALARLPAAEQKACRALWAEVDELLKKSMAAKR